VKLLFDHDVPDDTAYGLSAQGHDVIRLRDVIDPQASDEEVLRFAATNDYVLITCNRDDFLGLAETIPHAGLIMLIRRGARVRERAALLRLLDRAGEQGIRKNTNFAQISNYENTFESRTSYLDGRNYLRFSTRGLESANAAERHS